MRILSVFVVLALVAAAVTADAALRCPTVLDGLTPMGSYDLQEQQATSVIGAHWSGLAESDVLGYEYAVISESLLLPAFAASSCRSVSGFTGIPDVIDWTFVRKETAFASSDVTLSIGSRYFVVVRTILHNGTQVYSNSNGVRVIAPFVSSQDESASPRLEKHSRAVEAQLEPLDIVNAVCPISTANRCRQASQTVGARLTEIYGPAQFSNSGQISTLFLIPTTVQDAANIGLNPLDSREGRLAAGFAADQPLANSSSSDDDDYEAVLPGVAIAGIVVPITVGTMLLMALLALLAWLLASSGGRDYREGSRVVSSAGRSGAAPAAAAPAAAAPNDTVRMDFPDLDVRS